MSEELLKKKKTNIFDLDNDINSNSDNNDDDNFNIALKKNQFIGKKGAMLMELQKSYKGDERFKFDKRFAGDIEAKLVSDNVKNMTDVFDYGDGLNKVKNNNYNKSDINDIDYEIKKEKKRNLMILAQIITNEEFMNNNKKVENPKSLLQKRYDPTMNLGGDLIIVSYYKLTT